MFVRTFADDVTFASLSLDWLRDPWDRAQDDWRCLTEGLGSIVRRFYGHDRSDVVADIEIAEVKLDAAGYTQSGKHFGRDSRRLFEVCIPHPLSMDRYCSYYYIRARSIPQLKASLKRLFPNARVVRT